MRLALTRLAAPAGAVLLAACAPAHARRSATSEPAHVSAAIVTGEELAKESRPLLDLLMRRFPNMEVVYTLTCPEVHLRGHSTLVTPSNPAIYVDGNRASNTCILTELNTIDLAQVEVYPSGIPGRPGYRTHPDGVILIFVRKSMP